MSPMRAVVVRHPRLQFDNAAAAVEAFATRRFESSGVAEVRFADDMPSGREAVASMIRDSAAGYILLSDIMNPLVDFDLVAAMARCLERNGAAACLCEGAIPGTQVEFVVDAGRLRSIPSDFEGSGLSTVRQRWPSQEKHNNQFDLYKYKRLKLFLRLTERLERMHELGIDEFVATLERDDMFEILAAYGEDAKLVRHEHCPHCQGQLRPIPMRMSQPFCGYLPVSRPLYHECERCTLIVASPAVHEDDLHRIYDAYDWQDFVASLNNPYSGSSPRCDLSTIEGDLPPDAAAIDLGGGVGNFSRYLKSKHPLWSVTHSDFAIKRNDHLRQQEIEIRELDFLKRKIGNASYDLITAWEVIEHLPYNRLAGFLDNVHAALKPGGYFVFSTPDFDSPLCRSFDFFAMCPPFHLVVYGERWLRAYFATLGQWRYGQPRACSDFLDDAVMWYRYGAKTCPSPQLRAASGILESMFSLDQSGALRQQLLQQGIGSEVIVTLQKRQ